jgi:hypothetical protein
MMAEEDTEEHEDSIRYWQEVGQQQQYEEEQMMAETDYPDTSK